MEIKAKLNYLRIAPRKVRLVADLIRGMDVKEAEIQLKFMPKRSSVPLAKLLNSAIANAKNNFSVEKDALFIQTIFVNGGPPLKRWRARARGRAFQIIKRTSHIDLVLGIKEGYKVEKKKAESVKEAVKQEVKAKPKHRAPKEIVKKPKSKNIFKRVFKRKAF